MSALRKIKRLRIAVIEDDESRLRLFRRWTPSDIVLAECRSGGQAMGFLSRLNQGELHGLLLDHDLDQQARTAADLALSGSNLTEVILRHVDRGVLILVHSMNDAGARRMTSQLKAGGFRDITRVPMASLNRNSYLDWISIVRDEHSGE